MVDPAFLHQRHKDGACFFFCLYSARFESVEISMAADGSFGADDDDLLVMTLAGSPLRPGLDHAHNRNRCCTGYIVQCQRRGGVAGDYERLRALLLEIMRGSDRVSGDSFRGLRTVGEAGSIAEVEVVSIGDETKQSFEDSEAAKAGVENADAGSARSHEKSGGPLGLGYGNAGEVSGATAAGPGGYERAVGAGARVAEECADLVGSFGRKDVLELAGLLFDLGFAVHG